eukprot:1193351-Prorocentrum_minimum.AAC.3
MTSFHGSSCATNGTGALRNPDKSLFRYVRALDIRVRGKVFQGKGSSLLSSKAMAAIDDAIGLNDENSWLLNSVARNGTEGAGGFTEGQLQEMGYKGKVR